MTRRARIVSTGHAVPDRVMTNQDLEKIVETSDEWIVTRSGIRTRHIAGEDEHLGDFAFKAAQKALEGSSTDPEKLDLILLATVTQEYLVPATSCLLQDRLGAKNAAAMDLQAGCTGFIYALSIADQFIRSGKYDNALVIGGEMLSKYTDWTDRSTCVLFADGVGAVMLEAEEGEHGVLETGLYADGSLYDFIFMPGGGSRYAANRYTECDPKDFFIKMRGNETFKVAVRSLTEVSQEVLSRHGLAPRDVDWLFFHQANNRIIQAVAERLGIDKEKAYINIEHMGNTSAASIPIALDEANRKGLVKEGQLILMSAFGAGLTWGSALVRW